MRIGVVDRGLAGWTAGANFSRSILTSLAEASPSEELYFLSRAAEAPAPATLLPLGEVRPLPGERWVRGRLGLPERQSLLPGEPELRSALRLANDSDPVDVARRAGLDAVAPVGFVPPNPGKVRAIGWIPDFQHLRLPDYFTATDRRLRDRTFLELARRAFRVMLSSESAARDFAEFAPAFRHKARVVRFASLLGREPARDPFPTVTRYRLPEKFALVANQFWRHKNHEVVAEALAQLAARGLRIPCVLVGLPADYRDPENVTLSRLLQQLAHGGLSGQVIVLGHVPRAELVDLLRAAAVIVQPSRFEGWSTTVEDAKALGRPLLCSDIPVHREQAPKALGFFGCDDPAALAALLEDRWPSLSPGPGSEASQARARAEAQESLLANGQALLGICREALAERG
jgi:glycosyltransferase involved in cell wall biosynthesis